MGADPKIFKTFEEKKVNHQLYILSNQITFMTSKGYWINTENIVFKNAIKPCKICGFCPYGQLIEEFPLDPPSREIAIEHNKYMIAALAEGKFDDNENMTREDAEDEIKNFNKDDYPVKAIDNKMTCEIFGHHCPVYYHAELLAEEEASQEEIDAFGKEIKEYIKNLERGFGGRSENQ